MCLLSPPLMCLLSSPLLSPSFRRKKVQKDLNEAQAQLIRFSDDDGAGDASW